MTRIIAGRYGGRRVQTPKGSSTRPTTERVREALFSRFEHLGVLSEADVLDLYAGSGALGLEAISRGAASAVLVESARPVAALAARNAREIAPGQVSVRAMPVERFVTNCADQFGIILADPPYDVSTEALNVVLDTMAERELLAPGGLIVVERSTRSPGPHWPSAWEAVDERRYGECALWFAQKPSESCVTPSS